MNRKAFGGALRSRRKYWTTAVSLLGLVVVWQIAAIAVDDPVILPSPIQVLGAFQASWQTILNKDLPTSLLHFIMGMIAALLIALPIKSEIRISKL